MEFLFLTITAIAVDQFLPFDYQMRYATLVTKSRANLYLKNYMVDLACLAQRQTFGASDYIALL